MSAAEISKSNHYVIGQSEFRSLIGVDVALHDIGTARSAFAFDPDKLERLVAYVIWRRGGAEVMTIGKIIWRVDAQSYAQTGKPITGATYVRERRGPVPAPGWAEALRKVERAAASSAPDMSSFDLEQMSIVDRCIELTATGDADSDYDYAWRIAREGEEVSIVASLASFIREPDEEAMRWGKQVATKLALP